MRLLGLIAQEQEAYDTAEQLFRDALAIWRDLGMDYSVATSLSSLGGLARVRKQYDVAEQLYMEALALSEKRGFKEPQTYISANLGRLAVNNKFWEKARLWFEKGLLLAREIGRQDLIANAQYNLAMVHEAEGEFSLALPLAQEALVVELKLRSRNLSTAIEFVERLKKKVGAPESAA